MFTAWLLRLLALLLLGGGGWALVEGGTYIVTEAGATLVVAGTVAVSGGVIALGLAGAVARLEAIRRLLAAPIGPAPRDDAGPPPGLSAAAAPAAAAPAVAAVEAALGADPIDASRAPGEGDRSPSLAGRAHSGGDEIKDGARRDPAPASPEAGATDAATPERRIKRTFTSGAGTYTMYEDGRMEAILPEGRLDFASLDDLRRHLDQRALAGDATSVEKPARTR